jgi:NADH-quinone oxidoreductase subunit L
VASHGHEEHSYLLPPIVVSGIALTIVLIGIAIAFMMYVRRPVEAVAPENVSALTRIARQDLLQDAANEAIFMRPGQALTKTLVTVDEKVIDGAVHGVGAMAIGSGAGLRKSQTGYVRTYSALILVGAAAIVLGIWVITQ